MLKKVAKSKIARNTFFLYILTLSNYFLGFLLIPYEARVLGPEVFGLVGFAMAFALAFQVIVDFGFMVSATELISRHRDKSRHVANIVSSTMLAKLYLSALAALLFVVSALLIPMVRDNSLICFLFFANGVLTAMMPDFFYRGIEKMKTITIRTVFVRGVGVALVLLFVKAPEHATLIPLFFILSSLIALIAVFYDITRNHKVKLSYAKPKDVVSSIQKNQ
jgi:PST family polysaccharide transporter